MIKTGDVLLVKGNGVISKLIKLVTRSKYSHVSLAISDTYVIEIDWKYRLQIRPIEYKSFDVYRLNRDLTNEDLFKMLDYAYSLIGTKYDFSKIVSLFFEMIFGKRGKMLFNNPSKYICSDIVDLAYQQIGIDLVEKYGEQDVTPDDISKSKQLRFIYSYNY